LSESSIILVNLSPEKKIAGILTPLFALRTETDLGIGDVEALRQFIDWSAAIGFKIVQLLPINEMGNDHSPYNAISAVAIEPATLYLAPGSPDDLTKQDFDEVVANYDLDKLRHGAVRHNRVRRLKLTLLERAFESFLRRKELDPTCSSKFDEFCREEQAWLEDYAFFRALMQENRNRETWDQWPPEHRTIEQARAWIETLSPRKRSRLEKRKDFYRYVQWIAHLQWTAIRSHAESRGIALMGDIPFGVSYYSADVYSRPDEFLLDWSGGAPPEPYFKDDEFTQKWGQNWGIPLYRWDVMRSGNFDWWRLRVRGVRKIFHVFRIDHVLGFYRIYAFPWRPARNREFLPLSREEMLARTGGAFPRFVPRDDSVRENCEANCREGQEYLQVVLTEAGASRVAGEDLGIVPSYVRPSLRSMGISTFKIPQWENYEDGRSIPGSQYERLSVATYATHDHKPLRALWQEALSGKTSDEQQARQTIFKILEFSGVSVSDQPVDFERDFYPNVIEALFRTQSWIAILMITDLLARKDRFNIPGTAANSNWSRRLPNTVAGLETSRTIKKRMRVIRDLLEKTGRIS
jgi:4-alpha-glucanotransferase